MGWLIAPVALVRAIVLTAHLVLMLGMRYPKAALVVLFVLFFTSGGTW